MKKTGFLFLAFALLFGFVLAACGGDDKDEKKKDETVFTGFTLTVSGLPALEPGSGEIYGAGLMSDSASQTPIAIGIPNSGVFNFYHPGTDGSYFPGDIPFTTAGAYRIFIALIDMSDFFGPNAKPDPVPKETRMYTVGAQAGTFNYSDSNKSAVLEWTAFQVIEE